jgi:UDP-hydrolysing UDP-N-acetyl-D-glucosamine 2-epimerase
MRLVVFTSGRQDWGALAGARDASASSPRLEVRVLAGGMHLRPGAPALEPPPDEVVAALPEGDDDLAVARAAGDTTRAVAEALSRLGAEALLLLGDRTETLAAALAATCLRLPIVHLHGGETSTGAIDDACRHAITRLAHLHCVAHPAFRERLIGWGELPERVVVSGAPALDALLGAALPGRGELEAALGRPLGAPLVLLTHHPASLGVDPPGAEAGALLEGVRAALAGAPDALVVCTRPNVDAGGAEMEAALERHARADPRLLLVRDLGSRRWWGLMAQAQVLVGNSSSGILEAPCFDLPVVNVGPRQEGRLRVVPLQDVPARAEAVTLAVRRALALARPPGTPHASAYGDGRAWARIVEALERLASEPPRARLRKQA